MGRTAHLNFSHVATDLRRAAVVVEIVRFAPVHNPLPLAA
jgi:hypothetical protein